MHLPATHTSIVARRLLTPCIHAQPIHLLRPTGIHLHSSTLISPHMRGLATLTSPPRSQRTISTSSTKQAYPSSVAQSTALLEKVRKAESSREAEDKVGQKLQEGGKGTEGAHYKGMSYSSSLLLGVHSKITCLILTQIQRAYPPFTISQTHLRLEHGRYRIPFTRNRQVLLISLSTKAFAYPYVSGIASQLCQGRMEDTTDRW